MLLVIMDMLNNKTIIRMITICKVNHTSKVSQIIIAVKSILKMSEKMR